MSQWVRALARETGKPEFHVRSPFKRGKEIGSTKSSYDHHIGTMAHTCAHAHKIN